MNELSKQKVMELKQKREHFMQGGGPEAIAKQHSAGKLTARERVGLLIDPNTFVEFDVFATSHSLLAFEMKKEREAPADAVIIGWGKIGGRPVGLWAQDFTTAAGTMGETQAIKIHKILDITYENKIPLIMLDDTGGARLQQPLSAIWGGAHVFRRLVRNSGVIPQIRGVMGPDPAFSYGAMLTDFVFMTRGTAYMYVSAPRLVKEQLGEDINDEELGGSRVHCEISGCADLEVENDEDCIKKIKDLVSFLPSNCEQPPPLLDTGDDPNRIAEDIMDIVLTAPKGIYDMRRIMAKVVDNGYFFEIKPKFASNLITAFARLGGRTVGILANQPMVMGGVLDADAGDKGSRFIRFCDAFNIPLIYFVDTPGYLIGKIQERKGILRHGAKMLYAVAEASVPQIQVCIKKSYAGAFVAMGGKGLGGDLTFAWSIAEIGLMSAESAGSTIFRQYRGDEKEKLMKDYKDRILNLYSVASLKHLDLVDDIIDPQETRPVLIKALEMMAHKRAKYSPRKHGNMPV